MSDAEVHHRSTSLFREPARLSAELESVGYTDIAVGDLPRAPERGYLVPATRPA